MTSSVYVTEHFEEAKSQHEVSPRAQPLDVWSVPFFFVSACNAHRTRQATAFTKDFESTIPAKPLYDAQTGGFLFFLCYFRYMDDRTREIEIAIDQWIREVDAANLEPEDIATSFQALCTEFDIPEDLGKKFVALALED